LRWVVDADLKSGFLLCDGGDAVNGEDVAQFLDDNESGRASGPHRSLGTCSHAGVDQSVDHSSINVCICWSVGGLANAPGQGQRQLDHGGGFVRLLADADTHHDAFGFSPAGTCGYLAEADALAVCQDQWRQSPQQVVLYPPGCGRRAAPTDASQLGKS
jgi:hypothetical protein